MRSVGARRVRDVGNTDEDRLVGLPAPHAGAVSVDWTPFAYEVEPDWVDHSLCVVFFK
jgi:hypothetical protein